MRRNSPLYLKNIELRIEQNFKFRKKVRFHVLIFLIFLILLFIFLKVVLWTNLAIFHKSETIIAKQFFFST